MSYARVLHIPCGPYANESERSACERLFRRLQSETSHGHWLLLSNILFSFSDRGTSDEIDLLVVGPSGVSVIEIKHWVFTFMKASSNESRIAHEADKLNNKVKRIAGRLRKRFDVGYVSGKILLTKDGTKFADKDRPKFRGVPLFGLSDWKSLLNVDAPIAFDDAIVEAIGREIEPKIKVSLSGEARTLAGLTNLELISDREDRFRRVYKGVHLSRRDHATLHLYDLSASDDKNAITSFAIRTEG